MQNRGGTGLVQTMVRQGKASGRKSYGSGPVQSDPHYPGHLVQDVFRLDGQYQGLVHFPADLVGAPDSGVEMSGVRSCDGGGN